MRFQGAEWRRAGGDHPGPGLEQAPREWQELLPLFPPAVREILESLPAQSSRELRELRLRTRRPLVAVFSREDRYLGPGGLLTRDPQRAHWFTPSEAEAFLHAITRSSVYALEREFRQGFLTLPGGHRVGFSGQLAAGGAESAFRHVAGFNVRIARQVKGVAVPLLPHLVVPLPSSPTGGRIGHTLIASPPGCGKTTVLRDLARCLSDGRDLPAALWVERGPGLRVVLIDERFELAAGHRGVPQLDVGPNTDVIDGCAKAQGLLMAIRALSPQVIVTDEIGHPDDLAALAEAQRCGVTVIASVHASSTEEALQRAGAGHGLRWERLVLLSDRRGPGTVERIDVISPSPSQ